MSMRVVLTAGTPRTFQRQKTTVPLHFLHFLLDRISTPGALDALPTAKIARSVPARALLALLSPR
jgi:hypothetical protein